jgi:predicted DNA-binding protein with PD1-like motif
VLVALESCQDTCHTHTHYQRCCSQKNPVRTLVIHIHITNGAAHRRILSGHLSYTYTLPTVLLTVGSCQDTCHTCTHYQRYCCSQWDLVRTLVIHVHITNGTAAHSRILSGHLSYTYTLLAVLPTAGHHTSPLLSHPV